MSRTRRQLLRRLGAVGATSFAAGCLDGGSDAPTDEPGGGGTDTTAPDHTETTQGTTTAADAQSKYPDYNWETLEGADPVASTTITMTGFEFDPLVTEVAPGTELTVVNEDSASHTITVPALDVAETVTADGETTLTVEETGTFDYVCEFHAPDMLGRLVVTEDAGTGGDTETPTDSPTPAAVEGPTVQVRSHPDLGDVLVDAEGMTLYMFDSDTQGSGASACSGGCASAWPPLTVDGEVTAGDAVTAELSTFERSDGDTQVAAAGWPLYGYASDEEPGDATGQGASGAWWVLRPDGTPVRSDTATPTPTGTSEGPGGGY